MLGAGTQHLKPLLRPAILALILVVSALAPIWTPASAAAVSDDANWVPYTGSAEVGCTWDNGCTLPVLGYHTSGAKAIDFIMDVGTPVYAAGPGTVRVARKDCTGERNCEGTEGEGVDGTGLYVAILHTDPGKSNTECNDDSTICRYSRYLHLSQVKEGLQVGDLVEAGDRIGTSGSTGTDLPHLHYDEVSGLDKDKFVKFDPGSMLACHSSTRVEYPSALPTLTVSSWSDVPAHSDHVVTNGGYECDVPSAPAVDVFLLVDLSGSFSDDLPIFKAQAPGVISTLKSANPNIRFGLGKYEDYPISPFGCAACGDKAYERIVDLTFDTDDVLNAISGLFTRSGGDGPQSQLPALFQAATGAGQDLAAEGFPGASIPAGQQASFRDGATKLILLWTDAPFHQPGDPGAIPYPGPSFDDTVDAILALDPPKVIGISSGPGGIPDLEAIASATNSFAPEGGVDCDGDGIVDLPSGAPLVCSIASSGDGIGEAIVAIIEAATEPTEIAIELDIKPGSDPNSILCGNDRGVIPVAVLTNADFDATTVDHATVAFEGAGETHTTKGEPKRHEVDVDNDGDIDLVFHFSLGDTSLNCESTQGTLTGLTFDGQVLVGSDAVRMIGG